MEHQLPPQGFLSYNRRQKLSEEIRDAQDTQMEITGIKASPRHGRASWGGVSTVCGFSS